nr:PREDICTED: taste receptor type 2 member 114-like [Anolis carolinensis]|eukprot:XP_016852380.1 PREDICTED: taste receptor type 2 member 114-like [Anolis carolinensis]
MVSIPTSPVDILRWTILGIVSLFTLLGNGFIIVVLGYQGLQKKNILPHDILLIGLSASRIMLQLLSSANYILCFISETYRDTYKQDVVLLSWNVFNMTNLWSSTWLSVLYCVKVTNFANCLFLWLKPRINMLVLRLLGMSIVISIIFSVPSVIKYLQQKKWDNLTRNLSVSAIQCMDYKNRFIIFLDMQLFYVSITFCISLIASTLLLVSLWKHIRNLKKSGLGGKDLSTQVHINVITLLLSYIFFYLLYFTGFIILGTNVFNYESLERLIFKFLAISFPCVHCIMLILTNPKLKEMAGHILNITRRAS